MNDDTLTMKGVEPIDLTETNKEEEASETTDTKPDVKLDTKPDVKPDTKGEADDGEGLTSFVDAFAKAIDGDKLEPDKPGEDDEPAKKANQPETDPEAKESRSASDFKKIKADRDVAQAELTELKAKLTELEDSDVDKLVDDLKSERDDLSQRLKLAAIERHPKFQKEFEERVSFITKQAEKLVGEDNAARVSELLGMDDNDYRSNAIEEIMMELSTTKQAQFGSLLTRIDEVRLERAAALDNADETYKLIVQEQQAQHDTAMAESNKLFDTVVNDANNLEVFAVRDDDAEWNNEVKQRVDMARSIFSGENDPQELARASLWAAAAPKYRELLVAQIELNRRLRKQIGENGVANPSISGGGGEGDGKTEPKSFAETFIAAMNQ